MTMKNKRIENKRSVGEKITSELTDVSKSAEIFRDAMSESAGFWHTEGQPCSFRAAL